MSSPESCFLPCSCPVPCLLYPARLVPAHQIWTVPLGRRETIRTGGVKEETSFENEKVIIVGDFNIHVDMDSDSLSTAFISLLDSIGFSQRVLQRLMENKLFIKKEKCEFHASRISHKFPGFHHSRGPGQSGVCGGSGQMSALALSPHSDKVLNPVCIPVLFSPAVFSQWRPIMMWGIESYSLSNWCWKSDITCHPPDSFDSFLFPAHFVAVPKLPSARETLTSSAATLSTCMGYLWTLCLTEGLNSSRSAEKYKYIESSPGFIRHGGGADCGDPEGDDHRMMAVGGG
ncbi:hypothetical protein L3Q82_017182 [Scortum barcoo]|uniref:Uncharacterized protein n=1 Tax=Scortum barcoo TaxID=214431 RepID=A0ACB8VNW8_9TELE|nr:hypothetical protein L3Q82_017182 [Scortum barcoo]